jgi:sugar (pentulose or hexulose) kinase
LSEPDRFYIGIDAGTSGLRAVGVNSQGQSIAEAKILFTNRQEARMPQTWKDGLFQVIKILAKQMALERVSGIAVDGQSGTVLLCDNTGHPISPPMFYNEVARPKIVARLADCLRLDPLQVPPTLGRVLDLWDDRKLGKFRIVHQADWLAGLLCNRFDFSDENNSLKLGYDPSTADWAFNSSLLPFHFDALPKVLLPSTAVGSVTNLIVESFGFSSSCRIHSGTTDGMAAFIAASGLENLETGTAVTSLGTTMVLKAISPIRVNVPKFGIYSHKLFGNWVAGGASNSGGGALLKHFAADEMKLLSQQIDPGVSSSLDYYPLVCKGERFPIFDPEMTNRTQPRPLSHVDFLAGLLESIAKIEKRGFDLMRDHGVPYPSEIKTVGGGSHNEVWLKIRERILGARVVAAQETEAAYGAALIALRGGRQQHG